MWEIIFNRAECVLEKIKSLKVKLFNHKTYTETALE